MERRPSRSESLWAVPISTLWNSSEALDGHAPTPPLLTTH